MKKLIGIVKFLPSLFKVYRLVKKIRKEVMSWIERVSLYAPEFKDDVQESFDIIDDIPVLVKTFNFRKVIKTLGNLKENIFNLYTKWYITINRMKIDIRTDFTKIIMDVDKLLTIIADLVDCFDETKIYGKFLRDLITEDMYTNEEYNYEVFKSKLKNKYEFLNIDINGNSVNDAI